MNKIIALLLFVFLLSCNNNEKKQQNISAPKVVEAKGYLVPKDSMAEPKVILVDESKLKKIPAGKPNVVATNTNFKFAGEPKIMLAGKPRVCTPGQDTFKLPKTIPVKDSSFIAGIPEVILAKDAANKEQNTKNFSSFGKLQGLKHGTVCCILQDNMGNLWFGTNGGGVSKYDGKSFRNFTNREGLVNNAVRSIFQDKSGCLWFGTIGGISKYDGKSFYNFTEKEGLANNGVNNILQDKAGNLWFGTNGGGLSKYDGKSFVNFTTKEGLEDDAVWSSFQDNNGNLWFGTNAGVSKYDGKRFTHFTVKERINNYSVRCISQDKYGNLWFGTYGGGVNKFDGKSFTQFTTEEGLADNVVFSILEDKSGNLWFGTYGGGVSKYDGNRIEAIERGDKIPLSAQQDLKKEKGKLVKSFTNFTEKEGLSSNLVICMLQDKEENLWFGTIEGGVSKYNGKLFSNFTDKEGLADKTARSILQDKAGNIWFGTSGGGVSKYDGKSFTNFTTKEGLTYNAIWSSYQDKAGNIWFGTDWGISKYDGTSFTNFTFSDGLINNSVYSILQDKEGSLWFGTYWGISKYDGNSFTNFTAAEGFVNNSVYSILQDNSGNLWFGTNGAGVIKYDGKFFNNFTVKEGLASNVVTSILQDKIGNLWFGTNGGGVSKYDWKSFSTFTEKEGLCNNVVNSMLQDKMGNLWFGTRFGLSKLTMDKLTELNTKVQSNNLKEEDIFFKNYTYEDGFLGIGCNRSSICESSDGTIWIGADDRITAYHPDGETTNKVVPDLRLTSLALFNENVEWVNLEKKQDSTLTLSNGVCISDFEFDGLTKWYGLPEHLSLAYNNNYLTFNFIGITMMQPKKVKYQYKLEGLDENWSVLTSRTEAPYGNLPHGSYTFKVKAMNSEGYWSEPFEYKFTIRPPFWHTWWFRTLIALLIISSIWYYIKSREKKLVAEKEKLEKTVEERTAEVVAQKHIVEEKHKEITDSINYAERIQRSFIATKDILDENLKDYFVYFQPKDVVSGDFYWASKLNDGNFALATADSTGHGVPGAIMSLLNITSLEKAIETLSNPSDIFNSTRKTIIERLKKDGSAEGGKDGMDASLTVYDFKNKKLIIAAANNPVWIIRSLSPFEGGARRAGDVEVIEIKADKMPVGKHDKDSVSFTQQEIDLQSGDVIYTLTDGFPDQFGGEKGKKFMSKNLRELLSSNAHLPMNEQKELLELTFKNWVGNLEQVDDVTLIGVRV